jgi:hypothetical protein
MVLIALMIGTLSIWANQSRLVIGKTDAGLFSCFLQVLNNLAWCERNNVEPVIYWGEDSLYYQEGGYNGATNVWEYYFEPLSSAGYKQGEPIWRRGLDPDRVRLILAPFDKGYKQNLDKAFRQQVHALINRHIKVKPSITAKADLFYNEKLAGKKTIGIHLRGTDQFTEVKNEATIFSICEEANKIAAAMFGCQFFIATDEESLLEKAIELLNGPVIFYDSYRSRNGEAVHVHSSEHAYSRAKLGEEVLIEVLMFARCDKFIHTRSNVSTAVLFFNPELENKVLY